MSNKFLKVDIHMELNEFDLDVDFELKKKRLGILGPSGCGKSMTLKSIAGIETPDEGIVILNTLPSTKILADFFSSLYALITLLTLLPSVVPT